MVCGAITLVSNATVGTRGNLPRRRTSSARTTTTRPKRNYARALRFEVLNDWHESRWMAGPIRRRGVDAQPLCGSQHRCNREWLRATCGIGGMVGFPRGEWWIRRRVGGAYVGSVRRHASAIASRHRHSRGAPHARGGDRIIMFETGRQPGGRERHRFIATRGKSGLHWVRCQATPGRHRPSAGPTTESATENTPPTALEETRTNGQG